MVRTFALLFIVAVTSEVAVPQQGGCETDGISCACYEMMVNYCSAQAANSPEGGYDVAYDQCVSNWYRTAGCATITPPATSNPARKPGNKSLPKAGAKGSRGGR